MQGFHLLRLVRPLLPGHGYWLMAAVFAPAPFLCGLARLSHACGQAKARHDLPSRKRADHPADGLSVAASRIAFIHARLQFFSAALFLDGPGSLPGKGSIPIR